MNEPLIDLVLPSYDVRSRHSTRVAAPPELVYDAVRHGPLAGSPIVGFLMRLRSLPARLGRHGRHGRHEEAAHPTIESLTRDGFTLLAERPGSEFVLGIAGQFWRLVPKTVAVAPAAFAAFGDERYAKAAWSFTVVADGVGSTLSTETRVLCPSAKTRGRFQRYWRLIGPFSGLIRIELLKGIRRNAERRAAEGTRPV